MTARGALSHVTAEMRYASLYCKKQVSQTQSQVTATNSRSLVFWLPRAFSHFSLMGSLGLQFRGDSCHLLWLGALSLSVILSLIALNSESRSTVAKNSV